MLVINLPKTLEEVASISVEERRGYELVGLIDEFLTGSYFNPHTVFENHRIKEVELIAKGQDGFALKTQIDEEVAKLTYAYRKEGKLADFTPLSDAGYRLQCHQLNLLDWCICINTRFGVIKSTFIEA
jgi:hypothetical protein